MQIRFSSSAWAYTRARQTMPRFYGVENVLYSVLFLILRITIKRNAMKFKLIHTSTRSESFEVTPARYYALPDDTIGKMTGVQYPNTRLRFSLKVLKDLKYDWRHERVLVKHLLSKQLKKYEWRPTMFLEQLEEPVSYREFPHVTSMDEAEAALRGVLISEGHGDMTRTRFPKNH